MIEVNDISKKYGNHYAVEHLSFSIERGKVYGFLGPNGAGKTTTMNIITGYLAPTSGSVTVDGKDILKEAEEAKKSIGYLPEIPPLYPDMTVYEYLIFVAELKKVPKANRKDQIEEIMAKTMISDMRGRMIKNLSKGYRQRVGLAQAIMGYPDVIILDEPMVGLDPKQILEIRELINDLKKNHTIILSSHILSEVSTICDHVMIISHGKMVASDTVENLDKTMTGESRIELSAKCDAKKLSSILGSIDHVKSFTVNSREDGLVDGDIVVEKGEEIRDDLSILLGKENIPIYKLLETSKSLEEIFLELTQNSENGNVDHEIDDSEGSDNESGDSGKDNSISEENKEVESHASDL